MNKHFIGIVLLFTAASANAGDGHLIAEIDTRKINMPVMCEDTAVMLNSYSDFNVRGKSDSDGDGLFFTLGGLPSMGSILGIFNIQGEEYKFKHKTTFTLDRLEVPEAIVKRKDGSTYEFDKF